MNQAHYEYYFEDASDEDDRVLLINNIDPDRKFAGDPFDAVSAIEEELGCPLAMY